MAVARACTRRRGRGGVAGERARRGRSGPCVCGGGGVTVAAEGSGRGFGTRALSSLSEATTIHWHGIHMPGTPYMDGARGVTQGPIGPGENFTCRFSAWPPGTHYYHSHMDAVQGARGLKGAFVIERADDPVKAAFDYDEDLVVFLADEVRAMRNRQNTPRSRRTQGENTPKIRFHN